MCGLGCIENIARRAHGKAAQEVALEQGGRASRTHSQLWFRRKGRETRMQRTWSVT